MHIFNKKWWITIIPITLFSILFIIFDLINITHFMFPYELREGANIELTKCFLTGVNPYSVEAVLNSDQPSLFYMYPFMYSLITAALSRVFRSTNLFFIHYIVSFVCCIGAASFGCTIVKKQSQSVFASSLAFFLLLSCGWRGCYISAFPDTMALLISMMIIYFVLYGRKKGNIAFVSFLTVILFYTKQYFIIYALGVGLYFLICDLKKMIQYILWGGLFGIISIVVVSRCFPLYWTYSLFFVSGSTSRLSISNIMYCLGQYCYIGFTFFPVLLMCVYGIVCSISNRQKESLKRYDLLLVIQFIITGISLFKLGLNDGAYLTYFLQLLVPNMIILGIIYFDKYVYCFINIINSGACYILCFLFVGVSILNVTQKFANYQYLGKEDLSAWEDIYAVIDSNEEKSIYYSPNLSFYAMDHDQFIYDYGQNEFVNYESEGITTLDTWNNSRLNQLFFPYADEIIEKHMEYRNQLVENITRGGYDMVIESQYLYFDRADLVKKYTLVDTYQLKSGTVVYDTDVWIKK